VAFTESTLDVSVSRAAFRRPVAISGGTQRDGTVQVVARGERRSPERARSSTIRGGASSRAGA
jgi:hypothetical protein